MSSSPESLAATAAVNDAVVDEVIKSYYPAVMTSATAARQRAQNAYAIASAVATAIVAAGIFGGIQDESRLTQALGLAALVCWLVSAALFMRAVAGKVTLPVTGEQPDANQFVRAAVNNARFEHKEVDHRLDQAQSATFLAIVVTLLATGLALFTSTSGQTKEAQIQLTKAGSAAVESICGKGTTEINGRVDPASISDETLKIQLIGTSCNASTLTLRLHKGDVASIATAAKS